jgi:hypothetical protein
MELYIILNVKDKLNQEPCLCSIGLVNYYIMSRILSLYNLTRLAISVSFRPCQTIF